MRGGGASSRRAVGCAARDLDFDYSQDIESEVFSRLSSFLEDSINCHRDHIASLEQRGGGVDAVVTEAPLEDVWEVPFGGTRDDILSGLDDTCSEPSSESSAICPLIPSMSSSQGGPSTLSPVTAHFPFQPPQPALFYGDTPPLPHTQEMVPTPEESPTKLQSLVRPDEQGHDSNQDTAGSDIDTHRQCHLGEEVQEVNNQKTKAKKKGIKRLSKMIRGWNRKLHK